MSQTARIAIVWQSATPLQGVREALGAARPGASIAVFADAAADAEALRRYRPQLLVVGVDEADAEVAGMLRVLAALLGDARIVLATPRALSRSGEAVARRIGAELLLLPAEPAAVHGAVETALRGERASDAQALLSLLHGLADEMNNPLLAALGHLRLLEHDVGGKEPDLAKVRAATRCLRRIQATLERARTVQRSSEIARALPLVDVGALLRALCPGDTFGSETVRGDPDLLHVALRELAAVGRDLAGDGAQPAFACTRQDGDAIVHVEIASTRLADWQLPRTFEPYYLSRLLRGTSHGLALFSVQQIIAAHGGIARARRRAAGGLIFELILPVVQRPVPQ